MRLQHHAQGVVMNVDVSGQTPCTHTARLHFWTKNECYQNIIL